MKTYKTDPKTKAITPQNTKLSILLLLLLPACFALAPKPPAAPETALPGFNTADGDHALFSITTGVANTAVGWFSLQSNTDGSFNTGVGADTLLFNVGDQTTGEGVENTATGAGGLLSNTTGDANTATGVSTLLSNTTGEANTATGFQTVFNNTDGGANTAAGYQALISNTTGGGNTADGFEALFGNTTGDYNTAGGTAALTNNTTGGQNTAYGVNALLQNSTGSFNTALGLNAGANVTSASNVICVGHGGANVDNSCFIGNIRDALVAPDAAPVLVDSAGKLGTTNGSSRRFKKEIQLMDRASEAILALKPVMFHYKSDKTNMPQFGLIAEEVAVVNPDLVVRDKNGEIYTVRYDAVNAMLLNEFLKEHHKIKQQQNEIEKHEATIAELKSTVAKQEKRLHSKLAEQTAQIETLASGVQKVTAQFTAASPSHGRLVRQRRWPELPRQ
jgi:hypothetical protein